MKSKEKFAVVNFAINLDSNVAGAVLRASVAIVTNY